MHISELAAATGTTPRLLRYYEKCGLLSPARTSGGYRTYDSSDIPQVRKIRALLTAGFGTSAIATLLPCLEIEDAQLTATCQDMATHLRAQHAELTATIEALDRNRHAVTNLLRTVPLS